MNASLLWSRAWTHALALEWQRLPIAGTNHQNQWAVHPLAVSQWKCYCWNNSDIAQLDLCGLGSNCSIKCRAQANPKHRIIEQYPTVISDLQIFPGLEQIRRFRMVSHVWIWSFAVSPVPSRKDRLGRTGTTLRCPRTRLLRRLRAAAVAAKPTAARPQAERPELWALGNEHVIVDDEDEDDDIMPIIYMI